MFRKEVRVIRPQIDTRRILVTSDVHGNLDLLEALLAKLNYRPGEDALVVVGDLLQKGERNLDTLRFLMELSKTEHVYLLYGNNDLFVDADDEKTLEILGWFREQVILGEMARELGRPIPETVEELRELRKETEIAFHKELAFLRSLPDILETDRFLFAHAGLESEDLSRQKLMFVLAAPRFHETAEHVFSKMLVVGHWPTANYHADRLSNAPIFNREKNILSIDGGNRVKILGQLNGILLDQETGQWDWVCVDDFPKAKAPCSQQGVPAGVVITWPENYVNLIEQGPVFSRCRDQKTGIELDIPNDFLYEDCGDGVFRTNDVTDARIAVERGETVSVVAQSKEYMLVMKDGEAGFLFLSGED